MGFELPIDVDYCDHPKVAKLIAKLGKRADVFPLRLWFWCAKFAKTGRIEGGAEVIEKACKWDGKPGLLHTALVEAGLLNKDGKTVHDWLDHAGRKVAAYERKKAAQKEAYRRKNGVTKEEESGNSAAEQGGRMEEECRNSADILPEECRNSANPINETKRNETETKRNETKTKPPVGEKTLADLAISATFDEGWGNAAQRIALWHKHLADAISSGFSLESLEKELKNKPLKTEPPWDFLRRLLESVGKSASKKGTKNGPAHRYTGD